MPELSLESRTEKNWVVLEVTGEVDLATAPQLRDRLNGLIDDGGAQLIVNLEGVSFLDSTGLSVLVATLNRMQERGGTFALAALSGPVRKVLDTVGLEKQFPIYESIDEAFRA
ncbi:MAG: STAS domain-containing protein [Actinomycetota bacterium]